MELRKNPKIDLDKKRAAFFNIGLAISLLLVTSAFEWKFYDEGIVDVFDEPEDTFEEIMEIPVTVQPPPPPPIVEAPIFIEVPDEEEIEEIKTIIDVETNEDDIIKDIVFDVPVPEEKVEEVIVFAEKMPEPIGGLNEFYGYVAKSMRYPNQARRMGIEGKVFVQFVVDKEGRLTEVTAIKGIGGGCDEEAVRVLGNAPRWSPGKQRGRPVKVRMVLPITFKLK